MNARAGLVLCLLLLPACAQATAQERRDQVIQTALESAVLGCQMALADPTTEWDEGAKAWCERLTRGCRE